MNFNRETCFSPTTKRILFLGALIPVLTLSACASTSVTPRTSARPIQGGTVSFAFQPGTTPDYIFPFTNSAENYVPNVDEFSNLMWLHLYEYGQTGTPQVNYSDSLANQPQFSNGGRTVTITLKPYKWSDGVSVTSRDVEFWINLLLANKENWGEYIPGDFPDNLTSESYPSPTTFSLTFNRAYGHGWLIDNELSQIIPLPQQAWDKVSATSPDGNYDLTSGGAQRVYKYLNSESLVLTTYGSNPLWRIVDGPFRIASFLPETGATTLRANSHYSGVSHNPRVSTINEVPFTTTTAEVNALRNGVVDYGYLPLHDSSLTGYFKGKGYTIAPWISWSITYININLHNPTVGPELSQLYIRQALESLVDQTQYIKDILHGYGTPGNGPVPTVPKSDYLTSLERSGGPDPFNPGKAISLLRSHGWSVRPGGQTTCASPGVGAHNCGSGIGKGAALTFDLQYGSGFASLTAEMEAYKSDLSRAGIELQVRAAPEGTVYSDASPCVAGNTASCSWEMLDYGTPGGSWIYNAYPSGAVLFSSGGGANADGYSSSTANRDISATHISSAIGAIYTYENYVAAQLPVLWFPTADYTLSVIAPSLHGTLPQNPLQTIAPEDWWLSR